MADFAKIQVAATYSERADYSNPNVSRTFKADDSTTPMRLAQIKGTAKITISTVSSVAEFTTVERMVIANLDPPGGNYITCAFLSVGGGATGQTQRIPGGATLVLTDVSTSGSVTLQANGASVKYEGIVVGT